jgi:hypothetical protein
VPRVGEQADVLRALGRSLDLQFARGIKITVHETFLSVEWGHPSSHTQTRSYQEHHLADLLAQARAMRTGSGEGTPSASLGELLRTLGQELDRANVEANGIVQEPTGFRVSGIQGGRYFRQFYRTSELLQLSRARREARGRGASTGSSDPGGSPQMAVGLRVFTQDGTELGTVSEVAGQAFKVDDPSHSFGFWLRVQRVATVAPGEWAQLDFPHAQLDRHRTWTPPMDA